MSSSELKFSIDTLILRHPVEIFKHRETTYHTHTIHIVCKLPQTLQYLMPSQLLKVVFANTIVVLAIRDVLIKIHKHAICIKY